MLQLIGGEAAAPSGTLIDCLRRNAETHGDATALRERNLGIWHVLTWRDYRDEALALAAGLEELGFSPGESLVLIGDNRARLYLAAVAALLLRGVPAPIYAETPPEELRHYARGNTRFAVAEDQEQVDKLLELRTRTGIPATIIYIDPRGLTKYADPGLIDYAALLATGRSRLEREPELAGDLLGRATPEDGAVLLHSSGTTGLPKRILLRHHQVLAAVRSAAAADYFHQGEEYVAYLPMAWIGDFVFSVAAHLAMRFVTSLPERQETVLHDMREIAPTLYFASARSWDNLLTRVKIGISESTALKRRIVDAFLAYAVAIELRRLAGHLPKAIERLGLHLGEALVFAPLKDQLGVSRVKRCYTAGEAIGQDTFVFFRALGLDLKQFYGSSETCALTAAQRSGSVRLHTVGSPMPGVEIRISPTGEILVRGASVFDGYVDDPSATEKAIVDGWLHTGDAGQIEPDGQLVVLGRVSEVLHTAGGDRFIPVAIENQIKFSPYVKDIAVTGAARDHLAAIVCIDLEAAGHWAQTHDVAYTSYADLSQRPEIRGLVAQEIAGVNMRLPEPLRVRRFANLPKEFDADDGEVTRTRKLRRKVIEERYADVIEALHGGGQDITINVRVVYETGDTGELARRLSIMDVG